ncbi:hypothetical protein [Nocardia testacea]|uniref:hypothetical protein n=1 Tax=Nocardia testacea TaxID=248551 RepID=UPI0012F6CA3D|nr:hypothetical protein [Nocardia testacea]
MTIPLTSPKTLDMWSTRTVTPNSGRQAIRKYKLSLTSALKCVLDAYPKANARIVEKGFPVGPGGTDGPPRGWNEKNRLEEQWYEENGHSLF